MFAMFSGSERRNRPNGQQSLKFVTWQSVIGIALIFTACVALVWREGMVAVMSAATSLPPVTRTSATPFHSADWEQAMTKEVAIALNVVCSLVLASPLVLQKELHVALLSFY